MKILGIDHVSIAAADLGAVLGFFQQHLGLPLFYVEDLPDTGVRCYQVDAGNTAVEILAVQRPDSPVQRFLATRGPGLHHICFRVDNLEETVAYLLDNGFQLVDPQPREDGQGRRVFLHPASGQGVLMGFVERHRA
jgi:methylmalonyl-CoA epimerase